MVASTGGADGYTRVFFYTVCDFTNENDNGINPFETLPAMPQMSIGCGGTAPSVQYGIASMLVSMNHV